MRKPMPDADELAESAKQEAPGAGHRKGARHRPPADDLLEPLTRTIAIARRLARIEWERASLALRIGGRRTVFRAWETVFVLTLTVACAIALVHGIVGGFARLFGGAGWAGEIVGSLLLLGATVWAVTVIQARRDRKHLRETQAKLGSLPSREDFR